MPTHAARNLGQIIMAYWHSQAVYVAAELGIADHLSRGPRTADELASACSAHPDALFRLLRALASIGIFQEISPCTFVLTPLAEGLRSDVPDSQRALAQMMGAEQYQAWGDLLYSVQTGKIAFDRRFGKPIFDYLSDHPDKARIFDAAMTGIHGAETQAVLDAYDFSDVRVLADIGGGNGSNLVTVLSRYPSLQGILFDLPHVVERAQSAVNSAGLADRCRLIGGNFFEDVPVQADAYLLRHIIHDWDDERSTTILRKIRDRIPADGRLLLIEAVIPPGNEPFATKFLDLTMLLIPGGKERTWEEYEELLHSARFEIHRVVPTSTEMSVIEAHPH
jgi:hypothetical protein